jgi:PIN domain nuclease of toxin-antitoxin system
MSAVIDASALIAFLRDEPGADVVESVLLAPQKCYAHALNLCEVYYDFFRASNQDAAEAAISDLFGLGIEERTDMDSEFWRDVGRLKAPQGFSRGLLRLSFDATPWSPLGIGRPARV